MILNSTQAVVFDPSNKEHRKAVEAYMKRNAWVDATLRFIHDTEYDSIPEQVKTKLLQWYLQKENARSAPKVSKTKPKVRIVPQAATRATLPVHVRS